MPRRGLWVEGWLFRSPWFVPSRRGDPRLGVACRTDLLLSSGAGLVLQHTGRWDGARGEGWLRTHATLVLVGCGGAGLLGAGDSGPSHAQIQTAVPGTTVLQGRAALSAASPGAAPGFQVFGAGTAERGSGEPCRAPLWSRLCLAVGQKQRTTPKGTWNRDLPALHWVRGELYSSPMAQGRAKYLRVDPARAPGSLCAPGGASPMRHGAAATTGSWAALALGRRGVSGCCCLGPARKIVARSSSEGRQGGMALC